VSRLGTVVDIFRKRGPAGLWSGTLVSLLLVSNPAIQFAAYEQLKGVHAFLRRVKPTELTGAEYVGCVRMRVQGRKPTSP
jgi:adenine nucleotide transporter 17